MQHMLTQGCITHYLTWLNVFAEAEHNPVPTDAQIKSDTSKGTGAITAPDNVVNTTNARMYIINSATIKIFP